VTRWEPQEDGYLRPHHPNCMGCGDENPCGMGLRFRIEDKRVYGAVTFDSRHEGAPGFAHGGAVATVMDDALGTMLMVLRRPAVTAKLEVNYRKPVFLGRHLEVEGWADRIEGRKLFLAGRMTDEGVVVAECEALFLQVEMDHFRQGQASPPKHWTGRSSR
jgi:acyl-coenzyme A thioesterase PaaI-like protein